MIEIRHALRTEMAFFIEQAAKEGWNPGLDDAAAFFNTDPNGFLIAFDKGIPVGCISAVAYGKEFGFMGFYIVLPAFRGRGIGQMLWKNAIEQLNGKTIGLDGVVAQQENYKKSGFVLNYKNIRFKGESRKLSSSSLPEASLEKISKYDRAVFGLGRSKFLSEWLHMPHAYSSLFDDGTQGFGYGVIRECREGFKIGPLFADSPYIAKILVADLLSKVKPASFFLDVPAPHLNAMALVKNFNMQPVFETARMYKGLPLTQDLNKIYGITSFELG